jgi:phosphatidylglycerophosphatase C
MAVAPIVVFDLDGTLLDGDSATCWMLGRIRSSWWRFALASCLILLGMSLTLVSRRLGSSVPLWVASVGMSERALRHSFSTARSPAWRSEGIEVLQKHISQGDRVVIATAAPRWLAEALFEKIGLDLPIVGSELAPFWAGWIGARHCRNEEKCNALAESGYDQGWAVAYSDSADDWPLLMRAAAPSLSTPHPKPWRAWSDGV